MFRVISPPIIRSTQLYLQYLVLVKPLLLPAAIAEELELVWVWCGNCIDLFWCGCNCTKTDQYNSHTTLKPVPTLLQQRQVAVTDMIYLSTIIWLTPGGSSAVHIYTQTIHRTKHITTTQITTNLEECGPCPVFANFTPAFALQLRKKHGKNLSQGSRREVRVAEEKSG